MSVKRPVVLMGVLLVMVLAYVARPLWEPLVHGNAAPKVEPPLAGENRITGLQVHRDPEGRWMASFQYFFTGDPQQAQLRVGLGRSGSAPGEASPSGLVSALRPAQRGSHQVSIEIQRPGELAATTTTQVIAQLSTHDRILASQEFAQRIDWPDWHAWSFERRLIGKSSDDLLKRAVDLIDSGHRTDLDEAKRLLERVILKDPQFDAGYVELARIAMKTNWGPEGLHQAERLLSSSLQIRPDSVNAKVLLGYVFAHQGRYGAAEALFIDTARADTKNLWLWANWGELLMLQGKANSAIEKYREAVTRPRTHDTYDRARLDAYVKLLTLLKQRNDIDGMEVLHKQRVQEFGAVGCYGADYARFLLQQRGAVAAAMTMAREALDGACRSPAAREALGLAHYMAWTQASGQERDQSLNQARVFLPAGPWPLYLLAGSERTVVAVRQLVATGESLDQRDNSGLNALAYALQRKDLPAARRLVGLGAHPDAPVGAGDIPVALLPVIEGDIPAIRLMQQLGVDYSKLRYQGVSAVEHARRMGDRRLLEALDHKARSL